MANKIKWSKEGACWVADEPNGEGDGSWQARFETFHRLNPHVYDGLVRLAYMAIARGRTRIGIDLLAATLVWESMMQTSDPNSTFKLNRNYTSRYARLIMDNEPGFEGLFELRVLRTD